MTRDFAKGLIRNSSCCVSPDSALHKAQPWCSLIPFSHLSIHCLTDFGANFFPAFSIPLCPFVMEVIVPIPDFKSEIQR